MAAETKTSFVQFDYCSLCRLSHKKRKKHIYSKKHQSVLNNILQKFGTKIATTRQDLFNPKVQDASFEAGAKFWCYFCCQDFEKHEHVEDCTVIGGGLLAHLVTEMHLENLTQFFWDNLINKKLKQKFILSESDHHIFQKASFLAVKKWQKAQLIERKLITASIVAKEETPMMLYQQTGGHKSVTSVQGTVENLDGNQSISARIGPGIIQGTSAVPHQNQSMPAGSGGVRRTMSAYAPGLTCILKQSKTGKAVEGNVHTDAMPPWLWSDTPSNQPVEIGPSMKDLEKHLETEKRAKLPKDRVGANFDRSGAASAEWLPSFGRVWSKGRRLQSKLNFEKELKHSGKHSTKNFSSRGSRSSSGGRFSASETPGPTGRVSNKQASEASFNKNLYDISIANSGGDQYKQITQTESYNHQHEQYADFSQYGSESYSNTVLQNYPDSATMSPMFASSRSCVDAGSPGFVPTSRTLNGPVVRPYKRVRTATASATPYQRSSTNQITHQQSRDQNGHASLLQTPVLTLRD